MAPYHGRLLCGLPRKACVYIVHCASALSAVDSLDLGGAHKLTVDRFDALSRQLFDAVG